MATPDHFVWQQLHALRATSWTVGVLTAQGTMILREGWSDADLGHALGWLRASNARGAQIFVRPQVPQLTAVLIDDIPLIRIVSLRPAPTVVVETSPGNTQCWLTLTQSVSPAQAKVIAQTFQQRWQGDPGSADGQHFGRLVGFTNRWNRHRRANGTYPLVRLIRADGPLLDPTPFPPVITPAPSGSWHPDRSHDRAPVRDITAFYADPRYGGDYHRADVAWALASLRVGVSLDVITATVSQARDLSKKGNPHRQADYVARTVAKAQDYLARA